MEMDLEMGADWSGPGEAMAKFWPELAWFDPGQNLGPMAKYITKYFHVYL